MTLLHYDSRDYDVAASEAAAKARAIMERQIASGKANAVRVLEQIDAQIPVDQIVPGEAAQFVPVGDGVEIRLGDTQESIHDHALGQFASRGGVPLRLVRHLMDLAGDDEDLDWPADKGRWPAELLAHNLNELYKKGPPSRKRYLMRSVRGEARGWLSDRYRRLDSRPLVESFVNAFTQVGAVPLNGYALETKVGMKAILPEVFEPVPNEPMYFYLYWGNSDFGDGTNVVRKGLGRLWCTNENILDDMLRQIHLGAKLDENFSFSQRTYELDTKASASAITDIVEQMFSPEQVNKTLALVKQAHEEKVEPGRVGSYLSKHLSKSEAKIAGNAFASQDIVNLPPGQTKWRLSNCISLLARSTEDQGRSLELQRIAGKVIA